MPKSETKFLICLSLVLILLTSLPYLYGYLIRPPETIFLGTGIYNVGDVPVYYSYIEQAKSGQWLFKDLFTSEPGQKPFLNLLWLAIGKLAKIFSLSPILAFHLSRVILIPLFVWVVYKFVKLVFRDSSAPNIIGGLRMTLLLFFFSSGFGGLISFFSKNTIPLENWWPEAYAFLTIYFSPHFIASWILIVASFYFLLKSYQTGRWRLTVWAGLAAALVSQFHAYYLALLGPLSLTFAIYELLANRARGKKILWQTFIYNLFLLPVVVYYYLLLTGNQKMAGWLSNLLLPTPPSIGMVLSAFGVSSVLAIVAICQYLKSTKRTIIWDFLLIWAVSIPILLYAPIVFQRRLIEVWQLPIVLFAAPFLIRLLNFFQKEKRVIKYFLYISLAFLFAAPNIIILSQAFTIYRQPSRQPALYVSNDLWEALTWLKKEGEENNIILSSQQTGLLIPFLTHKPVFLGHHYETIKPQAKSKIVQWFFGNNEEDEKKNEFLKQTNVKYVIWGEREKQIGNFQPEEKDYLKKIYENQETQIYQITEDNGALFPTSL